MAACATSVDDNDDYDSGEISAVDAAADTASDDSSSYGGYDSSIPDAASLPDSTPVTDAFPPPPDASHDAAAPDATPHDAATLDTSTPDAPSGPCSFTGALATFDLSAQTGDESTAPSTSSATGMTVGALSRSSGLTATAGGGSINSSGWPTTASANATHYYTFTVTPPAGCTLTLSTLALDVKASNTGPATGDVATSADAFATHTSSFAGTSSTNVTLSSTGTSAIEVRVYGYAASGSGGTFRIQDTLTLSGSLN